MNINKIPKGLIRGRLRNQHNVIYALVIKIDGFYTIHYV
jgi:hypothetical protein